MKVQLVNLFDRSVISIDAELPYCRATRQLGLNKFLYETSERGLQLRGAQIFYTDFANKLNVFLGIYPFEAEATVGFETVVNGCIQLSYKIEV